MSNSPLRFLAPLALAAAVAASEPAALSSPALRSGSIASGARLAVPVAGSAPVPIQTLADQVFVDPRARHAEIKKARRALFADPVSEEDFVETEETTTFETTLTFTVTDPAALRASSPRFAKHQAAFQGRGGFSTRDMSPAVKKEFDAFKADLERKPAGHPLKEAAKKGDDALLDAVAAGKGDITIKTSLVIPKKRVKIDGKKASVPGMTSAGLDYAAPVARTFEKVPLTTGLVAGKAVVVTDPEPVVPPSQDGTGKRTQTRDFLTGFTEYQSFDWSERWSFGKHDYLKVGAHAGYAFGLRAPIQITGVMEPTKFSRRATADEASGYSVTLSGKTLNGNEQYYRDLGLSDGEAADGHEFVMEADAYATVDVEAGWGIISIHEKIPGNLGIDWGADFVPPYDTCGSDCGFDLWVPASITRTQISLLGVVTGSAQIGVKLGGKGTVGIDYMSLEAGAGISSVIGTSKAKTHTRLFTSASGQAKLDTTLPALAAEGTKEFGYRLSNPRYDWTLTVTPGLKGGIDINAKPFFSEEIDIGPFWFGALAMKLGTLRLGPHDGTTRSYDLQPGSKTWSVPLAVPIAGGPKIPKQQATEVKLVSPAQKAATPTKAPVQVAPKTAVPAKTTAKKPKAP